MFALAGDKREVAWVYINSCSHPNPMAEELRQRIEGQSFSGMRLVPAQIGYFDASGAPECSGVNKMKFYSRLAPSRRNYAYQTAESELTAIVGPVDRNQDPQTITLGRPDDDNYRFDIWLTSLGGGGTQSVQLSLPDPRSGRVRRPQGAAPIKALPEGKSATIANVRNGTPVSILEKKERWYRVRQGDRMGYMHDTWVYVDQYESGPFGERHIQVKSFDNFADAQSYVQASQIPLSAYLATNGWFAVTLNDTYDQQMASKLVKVMKENGTIPDDAYMTYGNTYARKVCCQ
ncbi:SH3 domain-containing protein [Aminobacter aminovorans]|uniref:SH3 domain-containing protein n=1 Tax=Aminobacter aminovorans TaxID=83263 RepID=UPI00285FD204|nr:SH3 domain-containing protein [Aminobacter aminovorans]MDR7221659.1 hypothetical protein [Aminobacter aminovorans]